MDKKELVVFLERELSILLKLERGFNDLANLYYDLSIFCINNHLKKGDIKQVDNLISRVLILENALKNLLNN